MRWVLLGMLFGVNPLQDGKEGIIRALAPMTRPKNRALTCDGSWACLVNGGG